MFTKEELETIRCDVKHITNKVSLAKKEQAVRDSILSKIKEEIGDD